MKGQKKILNVGIQKVPVTVISNAEAEKVDFVVCSRRGPSPFDDNFIGVCSHCGCEVMYRWHAPRKPPKICIECAAANGPGKQVTTNKEH